MKKSHIIGIIGVVAVVAATSLIIFWPKKTTTPGTDQLEEGASPASTDQTDGEKSSDASSVNQDAKPTSGASDHADSNDPKMKKIDTFLERSRVLDEFKAMDELLEAQLEQIQDMSNLSAEDREELEKIRDRISAKNLTADYKKSLQENMTEAELDRLNEIHQDAELSRYKQAQVDNQSPEGQKALMEDFKNFKEDSIPKERLDELKQMDKNNRSTDNTLDMISSMGDMMNPGASKDPKKKKENDEMMKGFRSAVERANLAVNYHNTMNSSDSDLKNLNQLMSDGSYKKAGDLKQDILKGRVQEMSQTLSSRTEKARKEKEDSKDR